VSVTTFYLPISPVITDTSQHFQDSIAFQYNFELVCTILSPLAANVYAYLIRRHYGSYTARTCSPLFWSYTAVTKVNEDTDFRSTDW